MPELIYVGLGAAVALSCGLLGRRLMAELASTYEAAGSADVVALGRTEGRLVCCIVAAAAMIGWAVFGQGHVIVALPAGIGAALGALLVLDDRRHLGVSLELVALTLGSVIAWRWLAQDVQAVAQCLVAAGIIGAAITAVRWAALAGFGEEVFGDGDWALFAIAGACVGLDGYHAMLTAVVAFGVKLGWSLWMFIHHHKLIGPHPWAPLIASGIIGGSILC